MTKYLYLLRLSYQSYNRFYPAGLNFLGEFIQVSKTNNKTYLYYLDNNQKLNFITQEDNEDYYLFNAVLTNAESLLKVQELSKY